MKRRNPQRERRRAEGRCASCGVPSPDFYQCHQCRCRTNSYRGPSESRVIATGDERPWEQVVTLYERITGESISENSCRATFHRAARKLRKAWTALHQTEANQ
jgi:hypothetical protein